MKVKDLIELLKSVDGEFDIVLLIEDGRGGIGSKESVDVSVNVDSMELTFYGDEDVENWDDEEWIDE